MAPPTLPIGQKNGIITLRSLGKEYSCMDAGIALNANTFTTVLIIDSRNIDESIIQFKNLDAVITMTYQIFASAKAEPNFSDFTADEWINLLSPASPYNHNQTKTLAAGSNGRTYESFINQWVWVVVLMESASGTPSVKVWHAGGGWG